MICFNKPYGVLSQFTPEGKWRGLKDFIPVPNVYVAGRLDVDSEGLLLLTDDGRLQARIADPRFKMEKTYWVQIEGLPDEPSLVAWPHPARPRSRDGGAARFVGTRTTHSCAPEQTHRVAGTRYP